MLQLLYSFRILHLRPIFTLLMMLSLNYQTLLQISTECYQTFLQKYLLEVFIQLFYKISNFVSKLSNFIISGHLLLIQSAKRIKMALPV